MPKKSLLRSLSVGLVLLACAMFSTSCYRHTTTTAYATVETQVVASEMNECYVLRVQSRSANRKRAVETARKQGVHDVIFKNLYKTFGDMGMLKALANDPSIEAKNEAYFSAFFADQGPYMQYLVPTRKYRDRESTETTRVRTITVTVDRGALKARLRTDGIIK